MMRGLCRRYRRVLICSFVIATVLLAGCSGSGQESQQAEGQMKEGTEEEPVKRDMVPGEQMQESASGEQATKDTVAEGNGQAAVTQADSGDIGLESAKLAALQNAGLEANDVTFVKEKMDYDDGRAEYDIEFVTDSTKYEYEVKADDGKILKAEQEPITRLMANTGTGDILEAEEAKAAALSHAGLEEGQAIFSKVELEEDDGRMEYELEFYSEGKEYSYKVDAVSSEVLEMEMEYE